MNLPDESQKKNFPKNWFFEKKKNMQNEVPRLIQCTTESFIEKCISDSPAN